MNASTRSARASRAVLLTLALAGALGAAPGYSQDEPAPPIDLSATGHEMPPPEEPNRPVDHSDMGHGVPTPEDPTHPVDHSTMGHEMPAPGAPREPIPQLTEADRIAAFPAASGHPAHDDSMQSYILLDGVEVWDANEGTGIAWDALGWFGTDLDRLFLRSEGERIDGATESADVELLYGRTVARWWDLVAGIRHDFGVGPSQTFVGFGVIGLAPYWFEIEATGYIGESGQTAGRFEVEYDMLLTNRLIAQWQAEADLYGEDDVRRGIGSGLSTVEAGVRVRYEFTRQFAPFLGVVWERAYGDTADFRREQSDDIDHTRLVAGFHVWF
jgi:copper resistance protein B